MGFRVADVRRLFQTAYGFADDIRPLDQFQNNVLSGLQLFDRAVAPRAELVNPGFDRINITCVVAEPQIAPPERQAFVDQIHRCFPPFVRIRVTDKDDRLQQIAAVFKDVRPHFHRVADFALDGETPRADLRADMLDRDRRTGGVIQQMVFLFLDHPAALADVGHVRPADDRRFFGFDFAFLIHKNSPK